MRLTTRALDGVRQQQTSYSISMKEMDQMEPTEMEASTSYGGGAVPMSEGFAGQNTIARWREWPEINIWVMRALKLRMGQVANAEWEIVPIDPKQDYDAAVAEQIRTFMQFPNPTGKDDSYDRLWRRVTNDVLMLDQGAIQPLWTRGGWPDAMKALDAGRVTEIPGWEDESQGPRYRFAINNVGGSVDLENRDLIMIYSNPTTYHEGGLSPLKVLHRILLGEWDTFKSIHILQRNRMPAGILNMPNDTPETVETVKQMFESLIFGRAPIGFTALDKDAKWIGMGSVDLQAQGAFAFYEMLIKAIAMAFETTPFHLGWTNDVNRANATELTNMNDDGIETLLRLYMSVINTSIVPRFPGSKNLMFHYTAIALRDENETADAMRKYAGNYVNPLSINAILRLMGEPLIECDNELDQQVVDFPTIQVASGCYAPVVWLKHLPQYGFMAQSATAAGEQGGVIDNPALPPNTAGAPLQPGDTLPGSEGNANGPVTNPVVGRAGLSRSSLDAVRRRRSVRR